MKKAACLILIFCSFFTIKAQSLQPSDPSISRQFDKGRFKFGLQGGLGISFFLTGGKGIAASRGGAFVEYAMLRWLGLQSGLTVYYNLYTLQGLTDVKISDPTVSTIYLMVPITLRIYSNSKSSQDCLWGGLQLGYLIHGHAFPHVCKPTNKVPPIPLSSNKTFTRYFGISIILGYDYEFDFGLTMGLSYTYDMRPVIRARFVGFNWSLQPTIGYNIAKLLQQKTL